MSFLPLTKFSVKHALKSEDKIRYQTFGVTFIFFKGRVIVNLPGTVEIPKTRSILQHHDSSTARTPCFPHKVAMETTP